MSGWPPGPRRPGPVRILGPMQYAESILDLVGQTPLVRIDRLLRGLGPADRLPLVLAKLEMLNPAAPSRTASGSR